MSIKVKSHLKCFLCNTYHEIVLPPDKTEEEFEIDMMHFAAGGRIKNIFNYLTSDERELLLVGYCKKAWNQFYGDVKIG